jgi:hypothetical protein
LPVKVTFPKEKFQFSGHETFPLRQMWLPKAYRKAEANGWGTELFSSDSAIATFGVGKNMVSAIRHWALACDVLVEREKSLEGGEVGNFLLRGQGHDPYLENISSLWLLHWILCGRGKRATTWAWLFSFLEREEFDRDIALSALAAFVEDRGEKVKITTLKRDLETCLKTYLPRASADSKEEAAEPILSDLGIIRQSLSGRSFTFDRGDKPQLSHEVFAFAVCDFWERNPGVNASVATLPFAAVATARGSPGRVFKLRENAVADKLAALDDLTGGRLRWVDSGGIKSIALKSGETLSKLKFDILPSAYTGKLK